jgi:hypothetical protein
MNLNRGNTTMKNSFWKLLLFALFCQFTGALAMEKEYPDRLLTQDEYAAYGRYIAKMNKFALSQKYKKVEYVADGDYSKLQYIIFSNKKQYQLGEPIYIWSRIKNNSEYYVVLGEPLSFFGTDYVKIINDNREKAPMTQYGKTRYEIQEKNESELGIGCGIFSKKGFGMVFSNHYAFLRRQAHEKTPSPVLLNNYFDLTIPGKYQITFYRKSFMIGQRYDSPLESNTIILEVTSQLFIPNEFLSDDYLKTLVENKSGEGTLHDSF